MVVAPPPVCHIHDRGVEMRVWVPRCGESESGGAQEKRGVATLG